MAAYAALISLCNILDDISYPNPSFTSLTKKHIESLQHQISFLVDFLENHTQRRTKEIESLEIPIRDVAYAAEDLIETHIVDQIEEQRQRKNWGLETHRVDQIEERRRKKGRGPVKLYLILRKSMFFLKKKNYTCILGFRHPSRSRGPDIHKLTEEMESIEKQVANIIERKGVKYEKQQQQIPTRGTPTGKNKMVGFDDKLIEILDVLTGDESSRKTISVTGMGGMGKTTLARNTYEHPLIVQRFDFRAWVVVSQEFTGKEIISGILGGDNQNKSYEELGEQLHKYLSYRRYLIVMDDIWSVEAWEMVQRFLPDNSNGSRIMITTRLSMLASDVSSCSPAPYKMDFLDEDKSWSLLQEKVFGGEYCCPPELEDVGKKIAKDCRGVPLAIVVIGGILAKSNGVRSFWEHVAEDVTMVVRNQNDQHCMEILSLSYNHLPVHLKPCFLYMGVFREDMEIRVSRLIKLWTCEGFLKPDKNKSLEEVAEEYLNDLIDRNLIMVRKLGSRGKIKSCNVHDLLRELCIMEAEKETFFGVMQLYNEDPPLGNESRRRLSLQTGGKWEWRVCPRVVGALQTATVARSFVCDYHVREIPFPAHLRLLRVLDATAEYYTGKNLDLQIPQLVNARYISLLVQQEEIQLLHPAVSLLWNLQTIIIYAVCYVEDIVLPFEIWSMTKLKNIQISNQVLLPDPQGQNSLILNNLQTLSTVKNFKCQKNILRRVPNIKKLKLTYRNDSVIDFTGLISLHKLESLTLWYVKLDKQDFALPYSLKKLSFIGSYLHLENMRVIGSLPNLEVLKIREPATDGSPFWDPIEGEFLCLKFLKFYKFDYLHWGEDAIHFPSLEKIILKYMDTLEIPSGIGDIPTLQLIKVKKCKSPVEDSANRISKEQKDMGNESLQVQVIPRKTWEVDASPEQTPMFFDLNDTPPSEDIEDEPL